MGAEGSGGGSRGGPGGQVRVRGAAVGAGGQVGVVVVGQDNNSATRSAAGAKYSNFTRTVSVWTGPSRPDWTVPQLAGQSTVGLVLLGPAGLYYHLPVLRGPAEPMNILVPYLTSIEQQGGYKIHILSLYFINCEGKVHWSYSSSVHLPNTRPLSQGIKKKKNDAAQSSQRHHL